MSAGHPSLPEELRPPAVEVSRFWAPVGHEASVDGGFLRDPTSEWLGDAAVHATEDLAERPFVVLLGEQGMGKSHVLRQASCPLRGDLPPVDLGTYSTDDRVERKVLEAEWVSQWIDGSDSQTLVLDGLDEAQLYIPTIDDLLAEAIGGWPLERLHLRIACRGHSWSKNLELQLAAAYGRALGLEDFEPTVVHLLPLRQSDAVAIAASLGVDAHAFFAEVSRTGAGSLAGRPLTLRMLVERYRDHGSLDGSQAELYRSGLRALVTEQRTGRRGASSLTADQVLSGASRVAAAWTFGGHATVHLGPSDRGTLGVDDLIGGHEGAGASRVDVDVSALKAVLSSGLVRSTGDDERAWAHATFADYLTAVWMVDSNLSDQQLRSLLVAGDGHVWPQTRLAAGWCVAIAPDRFGWLVDDDPVAFIGDVDLPGDDLRAAVVDAIFSRPDQVMARGMIHLHGLTHPGLADQVRERLRDPDDGARWVALELARDCDVTELRDDLIALALDSSVDPHERTRACWALRGWGEGRQVPELLPLVQESDQNGVTGDDLFGLGLQACWPDTLPTATVLPLIREPARSNYYGSYASFLSDFADGLQDDDLPAIAAWLASLGAQTVDHHREKLANAALNIALRHLDDPATATAVVDRALGCLADYRTLGFSDDNAGTAIAQPTRRELVEKVIDRAPSDEVLRSIAAAHPSPLLGRDDLGWLIDRVEDASGDRRRVYEILLESVFMVSDSEHVRLALALPASHAARRTLDEWFTPQAFANRLYWAEQAKARQPPPADHLNDDLDDLLDRFDDGDDAGYWQAMQLLSCRVGTDRMNEVPADITSIGRWDTLTSNQRTRMLDAGAVYIERASCEPELWVGKNVLFHPARAAYRALVLMKTQRDSDLDQVSDEAWQKWAPVLADWTATMNGALWEDKEPIFERAISAARLQLTDSFVEIFEAAAESGGDAYGTRELPELMNDSLAGRLLALLGRGSMALDIKIVSLVADHNFDLVRPTLIGWLDSPSPQLELAETALGALWDRDPARSWRLVADRLDKSADLAARIVGRTLVAQDRWASLPAATRGEICLWMLKRFPRSDDPAHDTAHWVGPREEAGHRRDSLFDGLVREGTPEAVAAVRRILSSDMPGIPGRWRLAEAEALLRKAAWTPVPFSVLRDLAGRSGTRLVRSADDLLDAVLGAFAEIQRRLTGATPESHLLWNTDSMAPKGEDEVSDYLANRLKDELAGRRVVVNREVQVRRVKPTGRPRQADLQVDAIVDDDVISLPIEVKGSWHDEVETALNDQLAAQYVADLGAHGVYVVLFPDTASWKGAVSRRAKAARRNPTDLIARLSADAATLADCGLTVRVVGLDLSYAPATPS